MIKKVSVSYTHLDVYKRQLYDLFGINAELLIDHAWGYEPCTINDIKGYKPCLLYTSRCV